MDIKHTVLFCATDAGGARNIAPLLEVSLAENKEIYLVTNETCMPFFETYLSKCIVIQAKAFEEGYTVDEMLHSIRPQAIIAGVTRYVSIDRILLAAGRNKGIRTTAVLDEWYYYMRRFINEKGDPIFIPDGIAVMDNLAKREAIEEGIPEEICCITGSPALALLTNKAEMFITQKPEKLDFLTNEGQMPVITYLSETHAEDYGGKPGESGLLGNYLGYTEDVVRDHLLTVLQNIGIPCIVIEKMHPATLERDEVMQHGNVQRIRIKNADLWRLLYFSDAVVGMRSMAILEAKILGCSVISYQPNLIGTDYCSAVRLQLVDKISNMEQLEEWCRKQLEKNTKNRQKVVTRFPFADVNASKNVLNLAFNDNL